MKPNCVPYPLGFEPDPVESATLLEGERGTFLVIPVRSEGTGARASMEQSFAVVECVECSITKFGYPNDEGFTEHPLFDAALQCPSSIMLVEDSPWLKEFVGTRVETARGLARGRDFSWIFAQMMPLRHFLITLKEETFECIAEALDVRGYFSALAKARDDVCDRLDPK